MTVYAILNTRLGLRTDLLKDASAVSLRVRGDSNEDPGPPRDPWDRDPGNGDPGNGDSGNGGNGNRPSFPIEMLGAPGFVCLFFVWMLPTSAKQGEGHFALAVTAIGALLSFFVVWLCAKEHPIKVAGAALFGLSLFALGRALLFFYS